MKRRCSSFGITDSGRKTDSHGRANVVLNNTVEISVYLVKSGQVITGRDEKRLVDAGMVEIVSDGRYEWSHYFQRRQEVLDLYKKIKNLYKYDYCCPLGEKANRRAIYLFKSHRFYVKK